MQERIIKVFYGNDALPYKDKDRTIHFPIIGNAFMNASNTTEIRFYCSRIGGDNRQWIIIGKLPNGKRGFKLLGTSIPDSENNENYFSFRLNQFFTQYKGDLYLCLGGYSGNLEELQEYETYELDANAIVEATGAIKLNIAYSTPISGSDTEIDTWQAFLAELGNKANKDKVILQYLTYASLDNGGENAEYLNFNDGQLFYVQETNKLYKKIEGELVVILDPASNHIGFIYKTTQSGTLNEQELLEAQKQYCVFVININDTQIIYLKRRELTYSIIFDTLITYTQTTVSTLNIHTLSVIKFNGNYQRNDDSVSFYNESQSNARFLNKAGDTATGEIVFNNYAPKTGVTITDSMPNTVLITKQYLIDYLQPHITDYNTLLGVVNGILGLIPSEATTSNKLVDRDTMNSTINSLAAFFRGNYDNYETPQASGNTTLMGVAWQTQHKNEPYYVSNNDYAYVNDDETHNHEAWRYIYVEGTGWQPQFRVNEAPLTADQLAAINSGITSALVSLITTNQNNIATLNSKMPKLKDFTITSNLWQLVNGRYVCEIDAGSDFVFTDNASKFYTPISDSDVVIKDTYGINVSSNATTQKFTFICTRGNTAPTETINFNICVIGG